MHDQKTPGLWADGKRLVVSKSHAEFPLRCVKTNQENAQLVSVILKHTKEPGRRTTLSLPLTPSGLRMQKPVRAMLLAVASVLGIVVFLGLLIGTTEEVGQDPPLWVVIGLVGSAAMLLLVCPIFAFVESGGMLRIDAETSERFWIAGAHADFLEALPALSIHENSSGGGVYASRTDWGDDEFSEPETEPSDREVREEAIAAKEPMAPAPAKQSQRTVAAQQLPRTINLSHAITPAIFCVFCIVGIFVISGIEAGAVTRASPILIAIYKALGSGGATLLLSVGAVGCGIWTLVRLGKDEGN